MCATADKRFRCRQVLAKRDASASSFFYPRGLNPMGAITALGYPTSGPVGGDRQRGITRKGNHGRPSTESSDPVSGLRRGLPDQPLSFAASMGDAKLFRLCVRASWCLVWPKEARVRDQKPHVTLAAPGLAMIVENPHHQQPPAGSFRIHYRTGISKPGWACLAHWSSSLSGRRGALHLGSMLGIEKFLPVMTFPRHGVLEVPSL